MAFKKSAVVVVCVRNSFSMDMTDYSRLYSIIVEHYWMTATLTLPEQNMYRYACAYVAFVGFSKGGCLFAPAGRGTVTSCTQKAHL